MTGAVIALAAALVAAIGGVIGFGVAALAARKDAGDEKARADTLAVRMEVAIANANTEAARATAAERRADALDAALADAAVDGPVDGAFDRLLSRWRAARAAGGAGTSSVPDAGDPGRAPAGPGPDDLLRPGD